MTGSNMEIGASFSHRHLKSLNLDPLAAIKDFKKLGLTWVRLGCYWDESEKEPGKFSFTELDPIIKFCETEGINIALTVGMKAPRYPEYYIPKWVEKQLVLHRLSSIKSENKILLKTVLEYVKQTIKHFKSNKAIKVWQVENEPLDSSGEKWWRITPEFLQSEVESVRELDPKRKILINLWGNELSKRGLYKEAMKLADIIGFDIYLRHPIFLFFNAFNRYIGPLDSKKTIQRIFGEIKSEGKEVWLAELQEEPWEVGELTTKKENPPSFLPKHLLQNLEYGQSLNPSVILLWGFEWWYYRKIKDDLRYWNEALKIRA